MVFALLVVNAFIQTLITASAVAMASVVVVVAALGVLLAKTFRQEKLGSRGNLGLPGASTRRGGRSLAFPS